MYCRQQDFHGSDGPDSARSINIYIVLQAVCPKPASELVVYSLSAVNIEGSFPPLIIIDMLINSG